MKKESIDLLCVYDSLCGYDLNEKRDQENIEDILDIARLDQTCFDYNSEIYEGLRSNSQQSQFYI